MILAAADFDCIFFKNTHIRGRFSGIEKGRFGTFEQLRNASRIRCDSAHPLQIIERGSLTGQQNTDITVYRCQQIAFFDFIAVFHIRDNLGFLIEQRKYSCKYFHTGNDAVLFAEKLYRSLACFWHDSIRGYIFTGDIFLQRQQQQIIHI